jgi:hypothetical protein
MVNGATRGRSLAPSPEDETELAALETHASPSKAELVAVSRSRSANRGGTNRSDDKGDLKMTEKIKSELISRRTAFSLLGVTAAFALAVPATVLTVSDVEAQTSGMERRDTRREGRHERRDTRRGGGKETTGSGATGTGTTGTK